MTVWGFGAVLKLVKIMEYLQVTGQLVWKTFGSLKELNFSVPKTSETFKKKKKKIVLQVFTFFLKTLTGTSYYQKKENKLRNSIDYDKQKPYKNYIYIYIYVICMVLYVWVSEKHN